MVVDLLASSRDRVDHISLPVILDQTLKVFAVSCLRVWDIVVREPSLKLGLVPFVVRCVKSVFAEAAVESNVHVPGLLPSQLLATATSVVASATINAFAKENLILKVHYTMCQVETS